MMNDPITISRTLEMVKIKKWNTEQLSFMFYILTIESDNLNTFARW